MAKKKNEKFKDDPVCNQIVNKWGDLIQEGNKVLEDLSNHKIIPVSPSLDIALGGGIREGNVVIMTGDPKTGKTVTALSFAAQAQKYGKKVFYFDVEGRLTKHHLDSIKGLDPNGVKVITTSESKPVISAEEYLNTLETLVKQQDDLVTIVDSTSNMLPQDELDGEIRTGIRNALPRLLAQFFKRISGDVARRGAICIFITHNIANTGGSRFSPSKMSDGGNMLQYQAGTNMVITHRGKWESSSGNDIGQVAHWKIKTSAAGGIPNSLADSWIKYGVGIDHVQEIAQIASELSLIKKAGAWYTISTGINNADNPIIKNILTKNDVKDDTESIEKFFKFQGMQNLTEFLENNQEVCDFIYEEVKDMMLE